jgi:ABC-type transport system substrate-binding protein
LFVREGTMLYPIVRSKTLLLLVVVSIALVAVMACTSDEPEEAPAPTAMVQPTSPPAPTAVPDTPTPAPDPLPDVFPVDPATVVPTGTQLHDEQIMRIPNRMYDGGRPPWQDGGRQRPFSVWLYGTLFQINENVELRPYIAVGAEPNDDFSVWTFKLRDDAIYHDGTPITAADFKAYWEYGALPENIASWGGASLTIGVIKGWEELRAADTSQAEGLRVIDEQTLEVTLSEPIPGFVTYVAAWHTGISKLEQALEDPRAWDKPIGAGPYQVTIHPDTATAEAVAWDDAGVQFWGPSPSIRRMELLGIQDAQVSVIMFENAELDAMTVDAATLEAAQDPSHYMYGLHYHANYPGVQFIKNKLDIAPMEDLLVRQALGHGMDMGSIVKAVFGNLSLPATGIMGKGLPCHNPDARGIYYDPDLARQALDESTYGSGDALPSMFLDVAKGPLSNMAVSIKEYWKDNLGAELDVIAREKGQERREGSQFYRISIGSWILDPAQVIGSLTRTDSISSLTPRPGGYPVLDALALHAKSLPLDHPDRCAAFQAVEEEYLDNAYMYPIQFGGGVNWMVQPWVVGFAGTANVDINTLPWIYLTKH